MALNYHAPVRLLLRLVPRLRERRGQIVNVSALNLLMNPMPYWAAYQASKSAFDQWLRCAELNGFSC
jgi:NAD(P)-dependent dehydrogenase (short-subunit alcohol dehydrogenase family)